MAEKFSKWADKAGVNPFFPSRVRVPSSFLSKCAFYLAAAVVATPRLLVAAALAVVHTLVLSLLSARSVMSVIMLLGVTAYRRGGSGGLFGVGVDNGMFLGGVAVAFVVLALLRTQIKQLGIKVATLVLGVNFSFLAANPRRLGLAAGKADSAEGDKISPGDVVVCSLTNALEVVALESFLHNPMYVFPVQAGNGVTTCVSANFGSAFMRTLSSVMSIEGTGNKTQTLKEIATEAKHANRCVVLFAEGVRSNGDGVLRYRAEIFSSLVGFEGEHVHMLGFQYPSPEKDFSVAHPVGSFVKRLFWVASRNPFSPLSVKAEYVLAHLLKPLPLAGSSPKLLDAFVAELRDIQANLLKKNKVDMGPEDYVSFCEYYLQLSAGNIKDAAVIADKRKKH